MSVRSFRTSSIRTGEKRSKFWDQSTVILNPAFESIATATAAGGETTLTFTSIPATYQHLQIRGIYRDSRTSSSGGQLSLVLRFNNNTTDANYAAHTLQGNGSSATASGSTSYPYIGTGVSTGPSNQTTTYGVNIIDIHDYASTTKNKTIRSFSGSNQNSTTDSEQVIKLESMLWLSTSAINEIDINCLYVSFAAGSTFALYGIKAAA